MKKIQQFSFLLLCFMCFLSFSQVKFEKEYRISEQSVPTKALEFIGEVGLTSSVKWYVEQSQEGRSYEAKTRSRRNRLSIEFDSLGGILEVEKKVRFSDLDPEQVSVIKNQLGERFERVTIKKIQVHWSGLRRDLLKIVQEGSTIATATHFEIVLRSLKDKEHYEVLLTRDGQFSKVLKIRPGSFDNLEY